MVTQSELGSYLAAMGEFMSQVRDPEFRAHLERVGWVSGRDVVIAFDNEPIVSLISRLAFNGVASPCLIAIPRAQERFGFWLMFMESVPPPRGLWRRHHHGEPVSPQASVGMLYSSLSRCDAYVPSDWVGSASMTFSRVAEPA